MNVVIISSFFYPRVHPRSFRATELAKEFSKQGHKVDVITMNTVDDFDYEDFEKKYSIKIEHLSIFKTDGTAEAAGKTNASKWWYKIFRFCISYFFCGYMFKYTYQIYNALINKRCLQEADMVIALSTPFYIHYAFSKYIKKKGKKFVAIADSGDPFYYSKQGKLAFWFKYIEKNVYKQMDYLTIPTVNAIPLYTPLIPEGKIKIIPQGFDMSNLNLYHGGFGSKIRIAYAGVFYWDIRNPEFIFKYLDECHYDYELNLYMRYKDARFEQVVQKYPNFKKRLNINYNVPHDDLIYELSTMHFLLNIENLSNTQIPSKLIDYGMTNRPILSCNEINFSDKVINKFMNGIYDDRFIVNIDDYNIVNIVKKIMQLTVEKNINI